jgi:membrane protein implicated in regulation of membrane protease activity
MRIIEWLITAVFAVLLGWLGIERHRNRQKDQKLEKQEQQMIQQEKQVEVYKTFIEQTEKVQEAVHEVDGEQKIEEEKIEQAETVEDVIAAANDIVSRFNAGRM